MRDETVTTRRAEEAQQRDVLTLIGHSRDECPGCRRTTRERHARDCPIGHGRILYEQAVYRAEYVDARHLREAKARLRALADTAEAARNRSYVDVDTVRAFSDELKAARAFLGGQ
jgi:hypothetical protein